MLPQAQPQSDTVYRIQNVDYGYYLEFAEPISMEQPVGRILQDTEKQQWTFVADKSAKNTYKIVNSMTPEEDEDTHFALAIDPPSGNVIAEDADVATSVWKIAISRNHEHCSIIYPQTQGRLEMANDGQILISVDNFRDNQKWRLIEALPVVGPTSLPHDTYRISNIDGTSVLSLHSDTADLTLDPQEEGPHQAWELFPKSGGEYEIKKVAKAGKRAKYLSYEKGKDGVYKAAAGSSPLTWVLLNLGEFVYGLRPKIEGQKLALTAVDKTQILLENPVEHARNQVWTIDPYKVDPNVNPDDAQRMPNVRDGKYIPRNSGGYYAAVYNESHIAAYFKPDMPPLTLQYENSQSPYFTLRDSANLYIVPSGGRLNTSSSSALWYLVKEGNNNTFPYNICQKGGDLAWNGLTAGDGGVGFVFTAGPLIKNHLGQQWGLNPS